MALRDVLDWEEGVFRALLALWRRIVPEDTVSEGDGLEAKLADEERSLSVLAQALTGEAIRVRRARGMGGLRGADILLPPKLDLWSELESNRDAYRVQTVVASGMRRITRGRQPASEETFENALESLRIAREAVDLMSSELPNFGALHERVAERVLTARSELEAQGLPPAEAALERLRRSALAGERDWDAPEHVAGLVGIRSGRRRSPELPIWGTWLPSAAEAAVETTDSSASSGVEPTTELDAPDVDALRRVEIKQEDRADPAPIAPFERAESLDSYRGGSRDLDGTDELEAQLDALEQVDLGDLIRTSDGAQSMLKADLELGLDVADAGEEGLAPGALRYDEWDVRKGVYRPDWCTVFPARAVEGDAAWAAGQLVAHRELVRTLRRRLEAQRAGLRAAPRQLEGEEIDLDAAVEDRVAREAGRGSNPRVYLKQKKRRRDFATTILLDVSMSTDSWVGGRRILDVAREAALVLGEVAHQLEDRIQVLAFASETRNRCHVWEVLGFGEEWGVGKRRIAGLAPQGYTRIGPALRHATATLSREPAEKRLLLLISDGKPTDYDRYEGRYGVADVRKALREASRCEIHSHALAVDSIARDYLPSLFGQNGWDILPRPEDLVEALTGVYGRLTSR